MTNDLPATFIMFAVLFASGILYLVAIKSSDKITILEKLLFKSIQGYKILKYFGAIESKPKNEQKPSTSHKIVIELANAIEGDRAKQYERTQIAKQKARIYKSSVSSESLVIHIHQERPTLKIVE